jgi:redox-sensitive bicupin YhaK (pirin superfamily)
MSDVDVPQVEVLEPREVPLGGPRAMTVRRSLPQRHRSLIGAWCFLDHYGPDDVAATGGMAVPPHPHSGLQTVTWLFDGEVEHRDSGGGQGVVGPGEVSLMTAGAGIAHSEYSTPTTTSLHGVQLWVALPDRDRDTARAYHRSTAPVAELDGARVTVFVGELAGVHADAAMFSPLVGAEIVLDPHVRLDLGADETFEHGVLVDHGHVSVDGVDVAQHALAYVAPRADRLALRNHADSPARLLLIGGRPFGEEIVMWWNFVGRSHEDIEAMRVAWQAESERYGVVPGSDTRLDAPALPHVHIKPRGNPPLP